MTGLEFITIPPDATPEEWERWKPVIEAALGSEPRAEGLREAREAARQWSAAVKRHDEDAMSHWAAEMCTYITVAATPPAEGLDVDRLAQALLRSDMIRRYNEYSHAAHPETMRDTPLEVMALAWASFIVRAYAALAPEQPE